MQSEKESRLVHVEGLRGIAILYVVLFHAYMQDFALGFVGVDIFFVISGYFLFKTKDFQAGILEGSRRFLLKKVARLRVPVCLFRYSNDIVYSILNRLKAKGLCHVLHMEDALYDGGRMRTRENGEIRWLASKPAPKQ